MNTRGRSGRRCDTTIPHGEPTLGAAVDTAVGAAMGGRCCDPHQLDVVIDRPVQGENPSLPEPTIDVFKVPRVVGLVLHGGEVFLAYDNMPQPQHQGEGGREGAACRRRVCGG